MSISLPGMFWDVIITRKRSPSEPDSNAEWKSSNLKVGEGNKVRICGRDYWKCGSCGRREGEGQYAQEHILKRSPWVLSHGLRFNGKGKERTYVR